MMKTTKIKSVLHELYEIFFGNPAIFLLSAVIAVTILSYSWFSIFYDESPSCLGPPYLYATTHHEISNILKYSRDGCLLSSEVLKGGPIDYHDHLSELRSVAVGQYKGKEGVLYVADATSADSSLLIYDRCDAVGQRKFLTSVVSTDQNAGADHTYGIAFDPEGNIFVSFQHTDNVLRFHKDTLAPYELPVALTLGTNRENKYFPGTFYQFGQAGIHSLTERGIRSILIVHDNLWIANEDINGIAIVSLRTGIISNIVVINSPIGLFYDKYYNLVFVGSKQKHWGGAVYAIDPVYLRIVKSYTTNRMNHPSGIVSYDGTLFVAEQVLGVILTFDIESGKYMKTIVESTPGQIEQLALSDC
jgi:hypothetical protein